MRMFFKAAIVAFTVTGALSAAPASAQYYDEDAYGGYGPPPPAYGQPDPNYDPNYDPIYYPSYDPAYDPSYDTAYDPYAGYYGPDSGYCDPYYGCPDDYYDLPLY